MTVYLLKMIVCSSAFYALYALLFQREKMLVFNRIYLLAGLALSFWVPLIRITVAPPVIPETVYTGAVAAAPVTIITQGDPYPDKDYLGFAAALVFVLVSGLLLLRFIKNYTRLTKVVRTNRHFYERGARIVLVHDSIMPHSFLRNVFISKAEYDNGAIEPEVLEHELAHVRQKHSWDILFVEFVQIITWFNPVIYLYKRSIKINHELLADAAVVKKLDNVRSYQLVLLQRVATRQTQGLVSTFTFYTIKKRLIMLSKTFNKKRALLLGLAVVPLAAILIFTIGERVYAQIAKPGVATSPGINDTVPARQMPPPPPPFSREAQFKFSEWPVILEYWDGRKTYTTQMKTISLPPGAKNLVLKARDHKIVEAVVVYEHFRSVVEDVSGAEKRAAFLNKYGTAIPDGMPQPAASQKAYIRQGAGATDSEIKTYEALMKRLGRMQAGTAEYKKLMRQVLAIHGKMTGEQKKSVRPLEPSPPPVAATGTQPLRDYGPGATTAEMQEYIGLMKKNERIRNGRKVYLAKDAKEQTRVRELLRKMDAMQLKSVSNFPPPPPPPPPSASVRSQARTQMIMKEIKDRAGDTLYSGVGSEPSAKRSKEIPGLVIDSGGHMIFNGRHVKNLLVDGRSLVVGKTVKDRELPGSMREVKMSSE
ncbi:M56 family metallopeptidase [Niabella drilacis]|uniref:Signal transducer regulating beta-lactamase production, contains metallopeptidase domain n=1 Tax=Niabella drilacis (strain DSM 25811 / CCM 8410 / CCUG 62505 / LMG 26954 / E90) TaxID=1285928 RepID=A0A1G6JUR5_NIADE|nr:M56 family metallopeptidase [Niabella drilacis]SDC22492.1 Signal transducer regulating beta-lactamase production, contains metallopeptidase domain [Niabella drilacis]